MSEFHVSTRRSKAATCHISTGKKALKMSKDNTHYRNTPRFHSTTKEFSALISLISLKKSLIYLVSLQKDHAKALSLVKGQIAFTTGRD